MGRGTPTENCNPNSEAAKAPTKPKVWLALSGGLVMAGKVVLDLVTDPAGLLRLLRNGARWGMAIVHHPWLTLASLAALGVGLVLFSLNRVLRELRMPAFLLIVGGSLTVYSVHLCMHIYSPEHDMSFGASRYWLRALFPMFFGAPMLVGGIALAWVVLINEWRLRKSRRQVRN